MRPELGTCIRAPVNSKLRTCIQTQYSCSLALPDPLRPGALIDKRLGVEGLATRD